jgi:crossover junction endodeoxyribonuclease RusA
MLMSHELEYEGTFAEAALHPIQTPLTCDGKKCGRCVMCCGSVAGHGAHIDRIPAQSGMDAGPKLVPKVRPIVLALPYPISANRYWKTFVLGKRVMAAPSAEAKAYKKQVAALAKAQGCTAPILGRVQIDIQLYPERPQDWKKRMRLNGEAWDDTVRCLDLDNARKVVYDSLKGVAIEDDKWVRRDTGQRMEPDEHGARLIVIITPLAVVQPQGALL